MFSNVMGAMMNRLFLVDFCFVFFACFVLWVGVAVRL